MIRLLLGCLAALVLASCGPVEQAARDWPTPSPALWEVEATDGARGWLFGTIHALPEGVAWRTPRLEESLAHSGMLVVEIADLAEGAPNALFRDMAETPGQRPLSLRVEADERQAVQALMRRADAEDGDFARIESWAAALMLANAVRSGDPTLGVDRALIADAHGPVLGLESYRGQFELFDGLSQEAQDDLLAAVAIEAADDRPDAMVEAWLTGDVDELAAQLNEGMLRYPELERALLVERNLAWTSVIDRLLRDGRAPFVAVGTGHLVGEHGLPAQLEARGYIVRRIQ